MKNKKLFSVFSRKLSRPAALCFLSLSLSILPTHPLFYPSPISLYFFFTHFCIFLLSFNFCLFSSVFYLLSSFYLSLSLSYIHPIYLHTVYFDLSINIFAFIVLDTSLTSKLFQPNQIQRTERERERERVRDRIYLCLCT